jgi:hypothetical protein
MQVTETLRHRKNLSIVLRIEYGLNMFVIQQFFSQAKETLDKF